MARKTTTVTITAEGRDQGKRFFLTEKSAVDAEKWATRALMAVSRSGVDLDEDMLGAGMAGLFVVGMRAVIAASFDDAEPLLDDMMRCVEFAAPAGNRPLHETDIEEVGTILLLRDEVLKLHTGFSIAATLSSLGMAARLARDPSSSADQTSPDP